MEYSIDIRRIFKLLSRKMRLIGLVTLIAAACGFAITWNGTPNIYDAQVTLISVASGSYSDAAQSTAIMKIYAGLINSNQIAERVVRALPDYHLDITTVKKMVTYKFDTESSSAMFYINAISEDSGIAIAVANETANAYMEELKNTTGVDICKPLDRANSAAIKHSGLIRLIGIRFLFAFAGFILICCFIAASDLLNKKIVFAKDCTLDGEINLLAVIPKRTF
jgi:capsular polysaccharide biosynthesis protein